jgi:hypothetical protein
LESVAEVVEVVAGLIGFGGELVAPLANAAVII